MGTSSPLHDCMTDPFVTSMIEGRSLDATSRRSEELNMLELLVVANSGNLLRESPRGPPRISTNMSTCRAVWSSVIHNTGFTRIKI